MALRWCTRRSKLTLRCALRWSRLVFAPSMPLAGVMRCSHRPMGSPQEGVGGVLAAEPAVPVSDAAALVESRGVAGTISEAAGGMACGPRIQDLLVPGVVVPSEAEDDDGVVLDVAVHAEGMFRSFERSG